MQNLAHSASFHAAEKIAPSKPGIKHLGPGEEEYLNDMRALGTDEAGCQIYVWLSWKESVWFADHKHRWLEEHVSDDAHGLHARIRKSRELEQRHQKARMAIVMGEIEAVRAPVKH